MAALLLRGRLGEPAQESVNNSTDLKQIGETAERARYLFGIVHRRFRREPSTPVGPVGRNQRAAAIWQDGEKQKITPPPDAADHRQCPALESMALANDGYCIRDFALVMGRSYGAYSEEIASIVVVSNRTMDLPMRKPSKPKSSKSEPRNRNQRRPNDLSRCLTALDMDHTLIAVIEMSQSSWLVAGVVPGVERQPLKKLKPDEQELLALLERWRGEAERAGHTIARIAVAYEAGRDGFWLVRWLRSQGVEAHVIHASSVAVSREHRRAKTDRLDTEMLKWAFLGWLRGERDHCKMVAIPSLAQEDAKRPGRERESLVGEATRFVMLFTRRRLKRGIRAIFMRRGRPFGSVSTAMTSGRFPRLPRPVPPPFFSPPRSASSILMHSPSFCAPAARITSASLVLIFQAVVLRHAQSTAEFDW
jgi:hypothetical protein